MQSIPTFFGRWVVMEDSSWHFVIDKSKGGRVFLLRDGCTYRELVEMALDDFGFDAEVTTVDLSYPLPDAMLDPKVVDTPPMWILNDRGVSSLMELSRVHALRLCVSAREEIDVHSEAPEEFAVESDEDEGADDDQVAKEAPGTEEPMLHQHNTEVKEEDSDVDYSVYGKMVDSSEDESESDGEYDGGNDGIVTVKSNWTDQIRVNKGFSSKGELESELRTTALHQHFPLKIKKSNTKFLLAICRVQGCTWRVRAGVKNEPNKFWVTKYVKTHTCSVAERDLERKSYTPTHLAKLFIDHFGTIDGILPHHIKESMGKLFKIKMGYTTSYRTLIRAQELVRGSAVAGYETLPSYLYHIGKANPGSVTDLVCDAEGRFKYLFLSFGASIAGFQYVRRVIVVDGTHLTGQFEGTLLVAAAQDANFQVFPLAFGVVDIEDDESWHWFFTNLAKCFTNNYALTIVSDRHTSIANACAVVLPWASRGICYYHLQQNIIKQYRAKEILYKVRLAAYAYTLVDFNKHMDDIRQANPGLFGYLMEADPRLWSRVHFDGDRYNIKTSNIAESLNSVLKKAKGFPITFLLEFIREKLNSWLYKRREDALTLTTKHSRGVETLLAIRADYARDMIVTRIDPWVYDVRSKKHRLIVDLERGTCSCGVPAVEKIPCSHLIAAATDAGVDYQSYVFPIYGKDHLYATYAHNISPLEGQVCVGEVVVYPPTIRRGPGRRKKSRWQTWLEIYKKRRDKPRKANAHYNCSRCKQPGHTRNRCVSYIDTSVLNPNNS